MHSASAGERSDILSHICDAYGDLKDDILQAVARA
jgi:hypothetical protein